ncbi:TetR/AcrR family transcriptional regulator [Nonomuraea sp. NPDC049709]|uniref:TetR/AcrR family transcriptional regulator n=1 Tax=Nonomuraea sp. NPDC049709 TaxID=3154736 RepID=UPI003426871A
MRPTDRPNGRTRNPIIEAARRSQIIEAAIEVVAEVGYAQASLARIAAHAQVSKSVVSYHFADKDELLEQVVTQLYADIGAFIQARLAAEDTATGKIRAYITAELEYLRGNRARLRALGSIVTNHRTGDGELRFAAEADDAVVAELSNILRQGQRDGEFRDFNPRVMAITINQALDGALAQYARDETEDLEVYTAELTSLFAAATGRDSSARTSRRRRVDPEEAR